MNSHLRRCGAGLVLYLTVLPTLAEPPSQSHLLSGHVPSVVTHLQPIGRLPAQQRLSLVIGLPLRNSEALDQLIGELYRPDSPVYHRYLTPEQFTERFGPTEADYQNVIGFLLTNGFTLKATHPNRMIVDVAGSVADIERTFKLRMNTYSHPTEARTFFAPDSEPSVAGGLPILHIAGLDNYVQPHPASLFRRQPDGSAGPKPLNGTGPSGSYRGSDFRTAYLPGVSASLTGAGQRVALLEFDGYYPNDIATYLSSAGVPRVTLINILLDDVTGAPGAQNSEVALDIEVCNSMAPGLSAILVYEGQVADDILNRMATDDQAMQLSSSWSFTIDATTEQIFQEFVTQGQCYFNASGDMDAYSGAIPTPLDDPLIVSVGGTLLVTAAGSVYSSERVWNLNNGSGTGGGISTTYPIPSWQQPIDMSLNHGSTTMRNIPDVAMVAENAFIVADNGRSEFVDGTSIGTPLWAAFIALVNQQGAARALPPVGFINPAIYTLGTNSNYTTLFHDITIGSNTNKSSPTLFFAVPGYDLCTGWGSPRGLSLINALVPLPDVVLVTNSAATLVFENCTPTNGVIDPGETVTVNFALHNIGALSTTNLVATLDASGGVLSPSSSQTYGVLVGGGPAVTKAFTFTADGTCGSVLTATLELQDGASSLGTLTFPFQTGVPITPLAQTFDSVTAPALPSGWTRTISGGASNWVTSTAYRDTLPNSAFIFEPTNAGVAELISPIIPIVTPTAKLVFRNFYNSETDPAVVTKAYDGGVLEIKIGSGAYQDILAAGGTFDAGGYNKTIDPTDDNPLDGRQCWSGLSGGFITTTVSLPPAAAGNNIQLKWRYGTDSGNAYGQGGWYIDSISILDGYACCSLAAPTISMEPSNQTVAVGGNVNFTVAAAGTTPLAYQWSFNATNLGGATAALLSLTNVQLSQAGPYQVEITNVAGAITSSVAVLRVLVPPTLTLTSLGVSSTNVSISLPTVAGLNYELQYKNTLTDPAWTTLPPAVSGTGGIISLQDTNIALPPTRFYRVISY